MKRLVWSLALFIVLGLGCGRAPRPVVATNDDGHTTDYTEPRPAPKAEEEGEPTGLDELTTASPAEPRRARGAGDSSKERTAKATPPSATRKRAAEDTAESDAKVAPVAAPDMKAGRHDDNKQYNRFLAFLESNAEHAVYKVDVSERLVLRARDRDGRSLPNCEVMVSAKTGKRLARAVTYADGRTQFFPRADNLVDDTDYTAEVTCGAEVARAPFSRAGPREVEIAFPFTRALPPRAPLDIAIVIDTTGSMQNQIDRLKKTLRAIHFQLTKLPSKPDLRFALVAYRDRTDDYVTKITPFSRDVELFQRAVDDLEADGGGDLPEDMQAALEKALHELDWRKDAIRLGFVITDAPPHVDYRDQIFNYREAMRESLRRGIKWVGIGAGGLPIEGEVVMRQLAQLTMAEYVFITDSPPGDRAGGGGEASHHVGANYVVENLDQAIVRIVRRELSHLTDTPKDFDDTLIAKAGPEAPRDEVLGAAVEELVRQLADYSSLQLAPKTPVAVVPITAKEAKHREVAGYLSDRMALAVSRNAAFKLLERELTALSQEHKLQLSDAFDVTATVPIGKLIGAELLIVAKLTASGETAALFAKLIRVETGEVLSISRVELPKRLL